MKVGLLINPLAGIGGAVGLKGSDGKAIVEEAKRRGAVPRARLRTLAMFEALGNAAKDFEWYCAGGAMGGDVLEARGLRSHVVYAPLPDTGAGDTQRAVAALVDAGVAVIVFAGGDGTARDIAGILGNRLPVIGIPAGVKMHSGVFATSPRAAAEVLASLHSGALVSCVDAEVRDVDEDAARAGRASSRCFGTMRIPAPGGHVQHTKVGGREDEGLALEELVQGTCALIDGAEGRPAVLGPGGSLLAIKARLGVQGTLLGIDVRMADGTWLIDARESDLLALSGRPLVVVSFGRGQGIVFGRGNQQLSAPFLARLDRSSDVLLVATRSKLTGLEGRPLLLDTGDAALDRKMAGLWDVLCGYEDRLLYRVEPA